MEGASNAARQSPVQGIFGRVLESAGIEMKALYCLLKHLDSEFGSCKEGVQVAWNEKFRTYKPFGVYGRYRL